MIKLVQIAPRLIAAAYEFQASKDSRYMLNGMLIEPDTLVTTDGKGMFVADLRDSEYPRQHDLESDTIVSLPSKFITECRKLKHRDECVSMANLAFNFETGEHYAYVTGGAKFPFDIVEGTFPDWRRVIASNSGDRNPEELTLQGYLLEAVGKAAKLLTPRGGDKLSGAFISPREREMAVVRFHHAPECFAVLMPMSEDTYKVNDDLVYAP
jgi:hypothetical protein